MLRSFYTRYARWILAVAVATVPLIAWGTYGAFRSSNNNIAQWLPADFPETDIYENFRELFGADDFALVSWEGCTLDDPRLADFARRVAPSPEEPNDKFTRYFSEVTTGVSAIGTLTAEPFQLNRRQAIARIQGSLIGPDGHTTCALVGLSPLGCDDRVAAVNALRAVAVERCGIPAEDLRLDGDTVINAAIDIESQRAIAQWVWLAMAVAIVVAWFCLRRVRLVLMVFTCAGYCAFASTAMVYYTGGQMNLVMVIVPTLIYVLSLSASVHLANYYRDALRDGDPGDAVAIAVRHGWTPCALSAATTAIGLGSLAVSHIIPVKQFGLYSAIGVLLSLVVLFSLLPALLQMWPLNPHTETLQRKATAGERRLREMAGVVIRYRRPSIVMGLGSIVLCGWGLTYVTTSIAPSKFFPPTSRWIVDSDWVEQNIGPVVPVEVLLCFDGSSSLDTFDRVHLVKQVEQRVRTVSEVGATLSAATFAPPLNSRDWLRRRILNKQLEENREVFFKHGFLSEADGSQYWRVSARATSTGGGTYDEILRKLKHEVDTYLADRNLADQGVTTIYTGVVPLVYVAQQELFDGLFYSFCLAFALIAVVMILVLKNVTGGIVLMLPNVFPAAVVFGAMGWMNHAIDVGTMMTASVALGIAVDDTLHYLTWFRRSLEQGSDRWLAIAEAYRRCAVPMTQTTLIASLAQLAFVMSSFQPVAHFGLLMFVLLFAALVGDLILLPALLASRMGRCFQRPTDGHAAAQQPVATAGSGLLPTPVADGVLPAVQ